MIEVRPEVAARRREKFISVFKRLIEEDIRSGEFASIDDHPAATALTDGTFVPSSLSNADDSQRGNLFQKRCKTEKLKS